MSEPAVFCESAPTPNARAAVPWLEGAEVLSDAELLAALLGGGSPPEATLETAQCVLRRLGGLEALASAGQARLLALPGVGRAKAYRLAASVELGRRMQIRAARPRRSLGDPASVAQLFTARIGALDHEQMWVASLDGRSRLRGMRCVARGGAHGLAIGAREILRAVLSDGASAFVLVHNHPSGDPEPSADDVSMTRAVARAADVVGTPLLDHVVVTASGSYASLLDRGVL